MSQYFSKPYQSFGGDINIKVDLSNYATKTDLKNVSHVDVSSFTLKSTVCSDHVTYTFQSEFTLYSCLNVKELLA